MLANEKIAIAAHLHVLLRRKTGRVTDTEWMAANRDYAMEIVRFARQSAAEQGDADIAALANRLAEAMSLSGAQPAPAARQGKMPADSGFGQPLVNKDFSDTESGRERRLREAPRYVAGLR